jgi:hypothetical protein
MVMLTVGLGGCADITRFRVTGHIESATLTRIPDPSAFFADIGEAVRPSGFTGGQVAHENLFYYSTFSPERIDISLDPTSLWISVKDYNHSSETEFVREILNAIEQRIMLNYGARIDFKRVADFS